MKKNHRNLLIVLVLLFFIFTSKVNVYADSIKYIDVKLTRPILDKSLINLQSESGFSIYDVNDKENSIFYIGGNEIKVALDEKDNISLLDIQANVLFTIPQENNLLLLSNEGEGSTMRVEKDRYRGYLRFKLEDGHIILINHIEMEDYLYGLVPREMPYTFPMEALKAQAVAARTYATYNMDKHLSKGYNLCDTTDCQAYHGYEKEHMLTNLAVDGTKGILAYYNGMPIDAQYHSTSSGFTESSGDVWGGDLPYLRSVEDRFSLNSPSSSWTLNINISDLNNRLILNNINIGSLVDMQVIETSPSGSVKNIKLIGSNGEEVISGTKFRTIIGNTTLKSTCFNIVGGNVVNIDKEVYIMGKDGKLIPKRLSQLSVLDNGVRKSVSRSGVSRAINKKRQIEDIFADQSMPGIPTSGIVIEGKGYGHGVGMSQYGAKNMAEEGYTFEEILKHYYSGIDIL